MLLEGRPLYDTAADRELYVPHEEFARAISATRRGFNVLIAGPRGSGKTSLLRQLQLALREDGAERAPVFVDATAAETPLVLIEHVREAMRGRPSELRVLAEQAAFAGGLLTQRAPGAASTYVVRLVRDLGAEAPQTIVIDATGAGAAIYGLFGRLRDELWQLPHRWVVAIDADELGAVLRPPADAFFDVVLRLRGFSPEQLVDILERRQTGLGRRDVREIAEASGGSPRAAMQRGRDAAIEGRDPADVFDAQAWREAEASKLGRPHSMIMVELEALGAASASDKELLDRMGWTRERAAQVLGQLEDKGLVVSSSERQARGRPRKVFRPADPPTD